MMMLVAFDKIEELTIGDIVQHKSGDSYIVIETEPQVVAIRKINVTNPSEWAGYFPGAQVEYHPITKGVRGHVEEK